MGIKSFLRNWFIGGGNNRVQLHPAPVVEGAHLDIDNRNATRLTILKAVNGHLIQFSRYAPNPHGPDWKHAVYLVPEGQSLTEAVTVCMTLAELNK